MLSETELDDYFERHALTATAREYVSLTRSSPPFRRVGDNAVGNVCVQFASRKMGRTIQAESRTAEYAYALEFEYSAEVIEFWDQPAPVPVTRTLAGDAKRTSGYTPDYLVLSRAGPWTAEVKDANAISKLAERRPADWHWQDQAIRYLPAFSAFGQLGLRHVVCSTAALSRIRTANLRLLLRARAAHSGSESQLVAEVNAAFREFPFMTLEALAELIGVTDLTPILSLIDAGHLHARLSEDLLSQPRTCWVALEIARLDLIPEVVGYEPPEGATPVRLPSRKAMERYTHRMERLGEGRQGRSERRWKAELKRVEKEGGSSFEALRPRFERCGNRIPRVNPKCEQVLAQFISENYASPKRPRLSAAFREYKVEATTAHPEFPPVSYATFRKRVLAAGPTAIAAGRGGRRAANAASSPTDVDTRAIKPRRPFESGSLDHYNANIYVVIGERGGKRYTARPWISGLVDRFTGMIVAIWVSLKAPSSHSCAIVLRRCVRLHGRLPESIVVDRGSDFRSLFFMSTLASCGIDRVLRPAAHARFGSEIERLFGEFETQWLQTLPGNFANGESSRAISGSHSPSSTAELSIEEFWRSCLEFVEWRNSTAHQLNEKSRVELQSAGLNAFACSGVAMTESAEFIVDTAVDAREVTLEPNGCVRVGEQRFWAPELVRLRPKGKAAVRIEPENPHVCYVLVDGSWVTAKTGDAPFFEALDPVAQFAESLRLRECVSVRVALRDEAHCEFLQSQRRKRAQPAQLPEHISSPFDTGVPQKSIGLFERSRSIDVAAFDDTPTEVVKYVLGQSRK